MQIPKERQDAKAKEEIEISIFDLPVDEHVFKSRMPVVASGVVWQCSIICDPTKW